MPDFGIFCALRCAVLFKPTSLSVKKTVHAGIRHERFFGRSVIIEFQKTQIYQRFAGSQQEVFILEFQNDENNATQQDNGRRFHIKTMKEGHFHPASLRTGFFYATKRKLANGR